MTSLRKYGWTVGVVIGLLAGLMIAGLWPDTPLHAVATDRSESFALATGFVDQDAEAVFYLDSLTGTLRAAVLSNRTQGFQAMFETSRRTPSRMVIQVVPRAMSAHTRMATAATTPIQATGRGAGKDVRKKITASPSLRSDPRARRGRNHGHVRYHVELTIITYRCSDRLPPMAFLGGRSATPSLTSLWPRPYALSEVAVQV